MAFKKTFTLQTKIIVLVCGIVALTLLITNTLISKMIELDIQQSVGTRAMSIARVVSHSPIVVQGLQQAGDEEALQKYANAVMDASDVQFVVVFDMQGVRKTHPVQERLGERVVGGDELPALSGEEYTSLAKGTLGYSVRAFSPVYSPDGKQIGAVLVGILMNSVRESVSKVYYIVGVVTLIGILAGSIGAIALAREIRKILFGLEPVAIAKLLEERSAILQSVREGIIAVDYQGLVTLVNGETRRLLRQAGMDEDPIGKPVDQCFPNNNLQQVIDSGQMELNQETDLLGFPILLNRVPLLVNGKVVGAVATFRDKTEVKRLAEELTGVRHYVEALRSQSHEFMNRLHVILGLVRLECYDQVASFINQIASNHQAEVNFVGKCILEPAIAGFILSKLSRAREQNVTMRLAETSYLPKAKQEFVTYELVTIIGNLLENAMDAVQKTAKKEVEIAFQYFENTLEFTVKDSGEGVPPELGEAIFEMGISSKAADRGFGLQLVKRSLDQLQGSIEYANLPEGGTMFTVVVQYESAGD